MSRKVALLALDTLLASAILGDARAATLPTPCFAGSCGAKGPTGWVTSGSATAVSSSNQLTISQTSEQAILNWANFNVSADGKVVFNQPDSTAIALNRIFQASPSTIFGNITANGQIYLINPNGLIFGSGSSVNAAGILASTLNISDANFQAGLVSPTVLEGHTAALASDGRTGVIDANGKPVLGPDGKQLMVQLVVQAGAQLASSGTGGRVLLASQTINNAGTVSAPGGQVILAAGASVFLAPSTDPALRGLLVEVDNGGTAWNQLTGQISSPDGNVTLVGLAVNQDGRISASTSVAANGSVELLAQDTVHFSGTQAIPGRSGSVELGPSSSIDILPDLSDPTTAVADQTQLPSTINISGEQVIFHGGSQIVAPSGQLTVTATGDPDPTVPSAADPAARIRIDSGASIDLAGSVATLPMSANLLTVQLNAAELADDPLQRTGPLHGQDVVIDIRTGTPLADVSADIAAIGESVAQRTENGGSASFESAGDLVVAQGATLNVSGGSTTYLPGTIATSQLIEANGTTVNIGQASPSVNYVGVVNAGYTVKSNTWGVIQTIPTQNLGQYEAGYVQGASAGSLQFAAPGMVLNGDLIGQTVAGPYQRTPSTQPAGAQLILGLPTPLNSATTGLPDDYRLPSVVLVDTASPVAISDSTPLPAGLTLELPVDYLANGFTSTTIYSNGTVQVPAATPLSLAPGSTLGIYANNVQIDSGITAPGGALQFSAVLTDGITVSVLPAPGISIGNGVALDVRGNWTNDLAAVQAGLQPSSPVNVNGGSISLSLNGPPNASVSIGSGVNFELSGGAWLQGSNTLAYGSGGSLRITSDGLGDTLQMGANVGLDAFGVGTASGGTLTLEASRFVIEPLPAVDGWQLGMANPGDTLMIGSSLFNSYGLNQINLTANGAPNNGSGSVVTVGSGSLITVLAGTDVNALAQPLALSGGYQSAPSAASVMGLATIANLPQTSRTPVDVTLATAPTTYSGRLQTDGIAIQTGAVLSTDPGGQLSLGTIDGEIDVAGSLVAPGGSINLTVRPPQSAFTDPGFLPDVGVTLESTAVLNVAGTVELNPTDSQLLLGSVLPGGSISMTAYRGSVNVANGAVVDAAGTQGLLDFQDANTLSWSRQLVGSAGGTVAISAADLISWLGTLEAAAGVGTSGQAPGGTFEVTLNSSTDGALNPGTRTIELGAGAEGTATSQPQTALLSAPMITAAGIDKLVLNSNGQIEIDPQVNFSLGRELDLIAPAIEITGNSGGASLTAPYVVVDNPVAQNSVAPTAGAGALTLNAGFMEIEGNVVFSGLANLALASGGDVRLSGFQQGGAAVGSLTTSGNLTISADRIYPETLSSFSLTATGADSVLSVGQSGVSLGTPLSVGGAISLTANQIIDSGTILAPFGTITFNAANAVTFSPGSLTSVSADGNLLLYGSVINGQWQYTLDGSVIDLVALPSRQIQVNTPNLTMQKGATLDVSGGGDLSAYEWTPGTGGTTDALLPSVSPNLFAIIPSLEGQFAPIDPQEYVGSTLTPGQSVYLSGVPGLPAGVYPLLPARYALLPGSGAFLISALPGVTGLPLGEIATLPSGATEVAGYYAVTGTSLRAPLTSGFEVWSDSYAYQLADYTNFTAGAYLAAQAQTNGTAAPSLPADAGTLALNVSQSLNALGTVLSAGGTGGNSALIEISAPSLDVVAPATAPTAGVVQIGTDVLQSWDPSHLVLGGALSADGSTLTVTANSVTFGNGASLNLNDVTVVAGGNITLDSGAHLSAPVVTQSSVIQPTTIALTGTGAASAAYLEISNDSDVAPVRTAAVAQAVPGILDLNAGSSLTSNGAVVMNAPGGGHLDGALSGTGTEWSIGADNIDFATASSGVGSYTITPAVQSELQNGSALRLSGASIAFDESVSLGTTGSLQSITLDTGELLNRVANGASSFAATSITLEETGLSTPAPGTTPISPASGSLQFLAHNIQIGPGDMSVNGFQSVTASATGDMTLSGTAELAVSNDLTLVANRLLTTSDAQGTVQAGGTLNFLPSSTAVASTAPVALGGSITLSGSQVNLSGTVLAPSGEITANGSSAINVTNGALLSVAGVPVTIGGQTVDSFGGTLQLNSSGTLAVAPGATLSVSGAGANAAGSMQITATGAAQLDGQFLGQGSMGGAGGSFQLSAGSLDSFSQLNAGLEAGGFTTARSIDLASGNIDLAPGGVMTAGLVQLVAETGSIEIGGTITAPSGATQSAINLYAAAGVDVAPTGRLNANAAGGAVNGGEITLGTSNGSIDLHAGSVISAVGAAQDGTLTLRAPATGNDVAITEIASDTSGLAQVSVEPVTQFGFSGSPTDNDINDILTQISTYAAQAGPQITGRLQGANGASVVVIPGIEIDSSGSVSLDSLDLSQWSFNGSPAFLTVRAAGNVTVNGVLSDGFQIGESDEGGPLVTPLFQPSSTFQLVAGANLASPNPLATLAGSGANLTLSSQSIVRTGTGAIDLVAAQDVIFKSNSSAYTGGMPTGAVSLNEDPIGTANFLVDGGNVLVQAGRDVVAPFVTQNPTAWQIRGAASLNPGGSTFWGSDPTNFRLALGTFGGGDLTVNAGRDVINLSAATADSGDVVQSVLTEYPSGSLSVTAGRNVDTAYLYAAEGPALVQAGGDLGSDETAVGQNLNLGTMLLAGSTQWAVRARGDVALESVLDPTALAQTNAPSLGAPTFFTYGNNSSVDVESAGGDVTIAANAATTAGFVTNNALLNFVVSQEFPSNLYVRSYSGNIDLNKATIYLYPSATGQLDLFAAGNIIGGDVVLSDATLSSLSTPLNLTNSVPTALTLGASGAIHGSDTVAALITAGGNLQSGYYSTAKPVDVDVGGSMLDTTVLAQNLNPSEITDIEVAGNLEYPSSQSGSISVGGPGELELLVGGQINLGYSLGITTTGRLLDPQLTSPQGADIVAFAGLGNATPDTSAILSSIVTPSPAYQDQLISYVEPEFGGTGTPTFTQALQLFDTLSPAAQRAFVGNVFFNELVQAGRLANSEPGSDFARGYAAINALFPGSTQASGSSSPYLGDITLDFSRIYTLQGGSISLFTPGGGVDVGLAVPPVGQVARPASDLGIVAEQAGNVQIFSENNVLVNASRIFTLGGGNIAIWSTLGNIDAGRGAKSSVSAPPPVVLVDASGNITLDFSGAVTGSGIRTITTEPGEPEGNVDLVAPVGFVNAGDAGIGSAGNLNVAAREVLGTQNITVGGVSTGVPPEVSGIGASLSGATSTASSATNASTAVAAAEQNSQSTTPAADTALSWLDVFISGMGEENCATNDEDCLKRQKRAPK
jgi:filamentous hemagglutinin